MIKEISIRYFFYSHRNELLNNVEYSNHKMSAFRSPISRSWDNTRPFFWIIFLLTISLSSRTRLEVTLKHHIFFVNVRNDPSRVMTDDSSCGVRSPSTLLSIKITSEEKENYRCNQWISLSFPRKLKPRNQVFQLNKYMDTSMYIKKKVCSSRFCSFFMRSHIINLTLTRFYR